MVFFSGSFCHIYRVTDEALIAETMVWPNFLLMNVFFALKGSKLFIIISHDVQMGSRVTRKTKALISYAFFAYANIWVSRDAAPLLYGIANNEDFDQIEQFNRIPHCLS